MIVMKDYYHKTTMDESINYIKLTYVFSIFFKRRTLEPPFKHLPSLQNY